MEQQPPAGPLGTGVAVTHILVVADPASSRDFWVDVLGAEPYREYGGTSVVLRLAGSWLLLVCGWLTARRPMRRCGHGAPRSLPRRMTGARRSAASCETPTATWWRSASQRALDCGYERVQALEMAGRTRIMSGQLVR